MECKICNKNFKRINGHLSKKHNICIFEYGKKYLNFDVITEYVENKNSYFRILSLYRIILSNINFNKKTLYDYLRKNNVSIRTTSEAAQIQIEKDGIWNKDLNKETNTSIMRYSLSRLGKNNPIFNNPLTIEKIKETIKNKSQEEKDEIKNRSSKTLKERYKSGSLIHFRYTKSKEELEQIQKKISEGLRKYYSTNTPSYSCESKREKEIGIALSECNIKFIKHKTLRDDNKWFFYDFLLIDYNLIIEYNGSYWHCDPRKYDKDFYNQNKKMTALEIWNRDEYKKKLAENHKYNIIYFWEDDYKCYNDKEFKEKIIEEIKNTINKLSQKRQSL